MTNYNLNDNLLLDFESFSPTGIELSTTQVDRAVELSDRIAAPERQWQTYLNSLALLGFETWLEERDNSLTVSSNNCSVMKPSYASYIDGVFNLTIGEYKICLLTNGVTIDETIDVDRSVIELAEYIAHFYILVNVNEEQAEVEIDRFISYEEIIQHKQTNNLTPDSDWTYQLPLAWFNPQIDDLLLHLRCLEPSNIALPSVVSPSNNFQAQLEPFLPQLKSGNALHKILTWSQAAPLLSSRDLLDWLYELQTTQFSTNSVAALRNALSTTISEVTATAINVKSWLSEELNELARNLSWTLLPAPALATSGLRDLQAINRQSPAEEFAAFVTQLRDSGEDIPVEARGACRDFNLATHALRLFAITWEVEETVGVPEWSLLLVLGAQSDNYLPQGLKLEVTEGDTVLDEKIVTEDTDDSYIYTQVIGELDEQFTVKIILASDDFVFPDFVFE